MSDIESDGPQPEEDYEESSYQACYIFRPNKRRHADDGSTPQGKKRKVNGQSDHNSFSRLSLNHDPEDLVKHRRSIFEQVWSSRRQLLNNTDHVDHAKLARLNECLQIRPGHLHAGRISTALLLTGLDENAFHVVLKAFAAQHAQTSDVIISISRRQCSNLQTALKNVIKAAITANSGDDTYKSYLNRHKKLLPLNSDFELLARYVKDHNLVRLVLAIPDVEAFDKHVLDDLINTLHMWLDRIPFTLVLGITSTRQLFENRLSKSCLGHVRANELNFQPQKDLLSQGLSRLQHFAPDEPRLFLGPSLIAAVSDITKQQGETAHTLENVLHYAYLSHSTVNTLATLADPAKLYDTDTVQCLALAIRQAQSFRNMCRDLLAKRSASNTAKVTKLLNDDKYLITTMQNLIRTGQGLYQDAMSSLHALAELTRNLLPNEQNKDASGLDIEKELYQSLGDLTENEVYDRVLTELANLSPAQIQTIVRSLSEDTIRKLGLDSVSADMPPQTNGTATKKGKARVGQGQHTTDNNVIATMTQKLKTSSLDISTLCLHEAYVISTRTARIRQAFEPQPRTVLERALLKPTDYLGLQSRLGYQDDDDEGLTVNGSDGPQPAAAVVYTLLQEAPTIINVRDLFDAFSSRYDDQNQVGVEDTEHIRHSGSMAVFYRALAELKTLGLVRASTGTQIKRATRGKNAKSGNHDIDYVAKTSWAGL